LQTAKQGLLDNSGLDEQTRQSLQQVVGDPSANVAKLINVIQDAKRLTGDQRAGGLTVNQRGVFQERAIRNQIADTDSEIDDLEKRLELDFGVNAAGRSNEDLAKLGQLVPGTFFDTKAEPELQQVAQRLIELRAEKAQLRNQQRSFISDLVGEQSQAPAPNANDDLSQSSLADLLRAAAGN
jgi:hypothetical protein